MLAAAFLLSAALTGVVRQVAARAKLIDVPNERSSHTRITPRGGGIAVLFTIALGIFVLAVFFGSEVQGWQHYLVSAFLLGLVGFLDDRGHVNAAVRLAMHFLAAAVVVAGVGINMPPVIAGFAVEDGWWFDLFAVLTIVWLINLTNFMDGIDALTAGQVASFTLCMALILIARGGSNPELVELNFVIMGAVCGFLVWNLPPAKIFLGDSGSGFLGLTIGYVILSSTDLASEYLWGGLILYGVFIVDSTVTLLRRIGQGKSVTEAHRTHAYQHASRRWNRHGLVSILVFVLNLSVLAPVSYAVVAGIVPGEYALAAVYGFLTLFVVLLGAGRPETNN